MTCPFCLCAVSSMMTFVNEQEAQPATSILQVLVEKMGLPSGLDSGSSKGDGNLMGMSQWLTSLSHFTWLLLLHMC